MSIRLNTPISSLNAQNSLSRTTKALARAMERLASGKRFVHAQDDSAGLAFVTKLKAQQRGTVQAIRNMNEAFGYLNVAEGALSSQLQIITRMRELALQASNGIRSDLDRSNLDTEFQTLLQEFELLARETRFGDTKLLDGSFGTKTLQVGSRKGDTINLSIPDHAGEDIFEITNVLDDSIAEGTYATRVTYTTISLTREIKLVDLNGDGAPDLIGSSVSAAQVRVFMNNGNGTFGASTNYSIGGSNAFSFDLGDINSDGDVDILTQISFGGGVVGFAVNLGNGDGTFQARITTLVSGAGTTGSASMLTDLNGDAYSDVVFADAGLIYTYLGNGNGTFAASATYTSGASTIINMHLDDFNGDGRDDIVLNDATAGNPPRIMLGLGGGAFGSAATFGVAGVSTSTVDSADINADGKIDIVIGNSSSGNLYLYLGNGDGTFSGNQTMYSGDVITSVEFDDIDSDGDDDILALDSGSNDRVIIFENNGSGTFTLARTMTTGDGGVDVRAADLDGDGVMDIVTSSTTESGFSVILQDATTEEELNISTLNIATQSRAEDAIDQLDQALQEILADLASIGAQQSRLNSARSVSETLVESLEAARSQYEDVDYVMEVAELVRLQILQDSVLAVLAQANLDRFLVEKLLSGL